jgi:hypothetical protein
MTRADVPAWLLVLAGWLTADAALALRTGAEPFRIAPGVPGGTAGVRDASGFLASASPRELRQLPGLGERRATASARERWRRGHAAGPPPLEDIAGIGPTIAARVARALAERARAEPPGVRAR